MINKEKITIRQAVITAVALVLSSAFTTLIAMVFIAWIAILLKFGVWFYYWLG